MKYLRKTVEFGFSATILSTLLLTACGGGGGSVAVGGGATGTSVVLTPVKGKFEGSCAVTVRDANGTTIYSATTPIAPNGTTSIPQPTGASPFLVTVAGDTAGTCKYFNDDQANPKLMTLLPTESLNALLTSSEITAASASGVAVTAITEMAYQAASAVNGGNVSGLTDTDAKIAQGIAASVTLVGLTGASAVASIFTPPQTIPTSGTPATDDMGKTLEDIAHLDALPFNGIKWITGKTIAAVSPATPVVLPVVAPVGTGVGFQTKVTGNTASAVAAVATATATSNWLNDMTTSGVRRIGFGYADLATGMNQPADGTLMTATMANAVYTIKQVLNVLNFTPPVAWTPINTSSAQLTPTRGWIPQNLLTMTFTQNPDGSFNFSKEGGGAAVFTASQVNLTGTSFASAVPFAMNNNNQFSNPSGVLATNGQLVLSNGIATASNVIPVGTFTAGVRYTMSPVSGAVSTQDAYIVTPQAPVTVVGTGVQLTALPTPVDTFCIPSSGGIMPWLAQPNVVAGKYDLFNAGCVPPAAGTIPFAAAVTPITTLVNGVTFMEFPVATGGSLVIAVVSGAPNIANGVYAIQKSLKGAPVQGGNGTFNAVAATQLLKAVGLPAF